MANRTGHSGQLGLTKRCSVQDGGKPRRSRKIQERSKAGLSNQEEEEREIATAGLTRIQGQRRRWRRRRRRREKESAPPNATNKRANNQRRRSDSRSSSNKRPLAPKIYQFARFHLLLRPPPPKIYYLLSLSHSVSSIWVDCTRSPEGSK